jgi:hypothetical protein
MTLNFEQVDRPLKMIQQTREVELTCPECLDELEKYAQSVLDGMPIDGVLPRVREHLQACHCCNGQFELVFETLKAIKE